MPHWPLGGCTWFDWAYGKSKNRHVHVSLDCEESHQLQARSLDSGAHSNVFKINVLIAGCLLFAVFDILANLYAPR